MSSIITCTYCSKWNHSNGQALPAVLEATVTTVTIPGLGSPDGMFVLGDDTRLFSSGNTILQLPPSERDLESKIARRRQREWEGARRKGEGARGDHHLAACPR